MVLPVQNSQCSIVNNSGRDIVIALALDPDESATSNSVVNAGRRLELLKTSSGDPVIKNGSTGTILLDRTYTSESGASGPVTDYDLLVCDPFWLSPLASVPVSIQADGQTPFATQTITKDSLVPGSQAIAFYQAINTFPESQLTKDYTTALNQAKKVALQTAGDLSAGKQAVSAAINTTLSNFFKTTREYTRVTLPGVAAVDSYYRNFPAVWAQYKDSITYYLYTEEGDDTLFAGTLTLEQAGTGDGSAENAGYTCRFNPAVDPARTSRVTVDSSKAVNLRYADGIFSDDTGAATPAIALQGAFYLREYFDGTAGDTKVIVVITGQVNGSSCLGYDGPWLGQKPLHAKTPALVAGDGQGSGDAGSGGDKKEDNVMDDWRGIVIVAGGLAGVILFLSASGYAVYRIARYVKYKQLKDLLTNWDQLENAEKLELAARFKRIGVNISDEIGYDFVKQQAERTTLLMQRNKLGKAMTLQRMALNEMIQYAAKAGKSIPGEINALLDKLGISQDRIWNEENKDNLKDILPDELTNFESMQINIGNIRDRIYELNPVFRPQNTDFYQGISAKLYDEVESALRDEEREPTELDPVESEILID
ncbi:MAG: hypothetical protein INR73_25870 [Williamsia sp.]|nr:hypothetical protein [Williamsia sp.]